MKKKLIFIIMSLAVFLMACTDNDSNGCDGAPVITNIKYSITDEETIDSGALGDWIIIEGTNFCDISEIIFNDISADLFEAYIKPNFISINIPRLLPENETNTITIKTSSGTVTTRSFEIYVPDLSVKGLLNEYVKPGETGYIEGANFDIYQIDSTSGAWITFAGERLAVYREGYHKLRFKVPTDAKPNSEIRLYRKDTLDNIVLDMKVPGYYKDTRNLLYTANPSRDLTDDNVQITNGLGLAGYPDSIAGAYYVYKGDYPEYMWGGEWYLYGNVPMGQIMPDYLLLADKPSSELEVVFEVNVVKDWVTAAIKISLLDYLYEWEPYGSMSYKTNGWETIRISLDKFTQAETVGDETIYHPFPTLSEGELYWNWGNRAVYFHGPAHTDVFICWDNMRIVPKD